MFRGLKRATISPEYLRVSSQAETSTVNTCQNRYVQNHNSLTCRFVAICRPGRQTNKPIRWRLISEDWWAFMHDPSPEMQPGEPCCPVYGYPPTYILCPCLWIPGACAGSNPDLVPVDEHYHMLWGCGGGCRCVRIK